MKVTRCAVVCSLVLLLCCVLPANVTAGSWPDKGAIRQWGNDVKAGFIEGGVYAVIRVWSPGEGTVCVRVTEGTKEKLCAGIATLTGRSFLKTFRYHKFLSVHVWEEGAWTSTAVKRWNINQ